jgi:RHS repeat-associated protein
MELVDVPFGEPGMSKYKYNGKEYQNELGLNMYAMDMRQYDPAIGRWVVQDPVVHVSQSPYNGYDGNPVFFADPSGGKTAKGYYNYGTGNYISNADDAVADQEEENGYQLMLDKFESEDVYIQGVEGGLAQGNPPKNGEIVLQEIKSLLGKIWNTLQPREWTDPNTGLVYNINADGSIRGIRPNGSAGALGWIGGGGEVKAIESLSVIGPRAIYREFAKKIGANYLNVTDATWTWAKNEKFLAGVVQRGDDVIFAGKFNPTLLDKASVLAKEIRYLELRGYKWTSDLTRMILMK